MGVTDNEVLRWGSTLVVPMENKGLDAVEDVCVLKAELVVVLVLVNEEVVEKEVLPNAELVPSTETE